MKNLAFLFSTILLLSSSTNAQTGYDIKINLKGSQDSMVYLVKYYFDQKYIADTCKNVKNGVVRFKGKTDLEKGVYMLVSEAKSPYFEFFINENQKFSISTDLTNLMNSMKVTGNKENEQFFSYVRFMTNKNLEFGKIAADTKGKSKEDSAKIISSKIKEINDEVKSFETDFLSRNKGSFIYDVLNVKTEKAATDIPLSKNGRPDSIYQYYYYKNHYFDGVDFKDERIMRTPFFADRIKNYFEKVIVNHPDTVIQEMDKILAKCTQGNLVYNQLLSHFTFTSEQNKIMGFDKVFVHLADKYIISGKASGVYTEENVKKFKERMDIMRNLLLDSQVPDIFMIDTIYGKQVLKMGFDTSKTNKSITELYYKNIDKLTPMFRSLYSVKAKYTVLVFWAADCGHCKTEVPKLNEGLKELKGKVDFKVYAVQTKEELYDTWKQFIIENKLNDFINVFDPIHLNNLKDRFDIYSTPVIYILDKDKRIKAKRLGAEQVVEILRMLENIEKPEKKKT